MQSFTLIPQYSFESLAIWEISWAPWVKVECSPIMEWYISEFFSILSLQQYARRYQNKRLRAPFYYTSDRYRKRSRYFISWVVGDLHVLSAPKKLGVKTGGAIDWDRQIVFHREKAKSIPVHKTRCLIGVRLKMYATMKYLDTRHDVKCIRHQSR